MAPLEDITRPTKEEQEIAMASYDALASTIAQLNVNNPEIEIEETEERIKLPLKALQLLAKVLKAMSQGKPISIVPVATEMTTQRAAEFLSCSRPHLVKLLESGEIPFTKIGKHRRIKFEDIMTYKEGQIEKRKNLLIELIKLDEDTNLYDTKR